MDYIEEFKNLRTNNKWGRKSPHKAVLLLTIIEMFEQNIQTSNEIYYDDKLKSMFLKEWKKVLPAETFFHPDVYLPFWYLQSDDFWHIVPHRGKEDVLSLMRDTNAKPSEAKIYDSVKYAELDDDLYFLMTIPSGRSSLKKSLLETYTNLSETQIEKLSESKDNSIDFSKKALSDYDQIVSQVKKENNREAIELTDKIITEFNKLNEDLQIILNFEYYSFLKKHRSERSLFLEICPTVTDLYQNIINCSVKQGEIAPTLAFLYENFLSDLKISLMSEEGSIGLIDMINEAIDVLRGNNKVKDDVDPISKTNEVRTVDVDQEIKPIINTETEDRYIIPERDFALENRKGKLWTKDEEKQIERFFKQGTDTKTIAAIIGRTEVAIKTRLAKLGLISYTYTAEEQLSKESKDTDETINTSDFTIENSFMRCSILNKNNERVFSTKGKLKKLGGKLYRLNLKDECFTIKRMWFDGSKWLKGEKKIVAYPQTELYKAIDRAIDYIEDVEDIIDSPVFENCKLKVKGVWYKYNGDLIIAEPNQKEGGDEKIKQDSERLRVINNPLYAVRKQAVLRAMGFFRIPVKIQDVVRTISRTAWGGQLKRVM